jgi:hypothetical protein
VQDAQSDSDSSKRTCTSGRPRRQRFGESWLNQAA